MLSISYAHASIHVSFSIDAGSCDKFHERATSVNQFPIVSRCVHFCDPLFPTLRPHCNDSIYL